MSKVYAQVVNGMVNLVGAEEVGISPTINIPGVVIIDCTEQNPKPEEGWLLVDGVLTPPKSAIYPSPISIEPSDEQVTMAIVLDLYAKLEEKGVI